LFSGYYKKVICSFFSRYHISFTGTSIVPNFRLKWSLSSKWNANAPVNYSSFAVWNPPTLLQWMWKLWTSKKCLQMDNWWVFCDFWPILFILIIEHRFHSKKSRNTFT
jgi:hypothetical protein